MLLFGFVMVLTTRLYMVMSLAFSVTRLVGMLNCLVRVVIRCEEKGLGHWRTLRVVVTMVLRMLGSGGQGPLPEETPHVIRRGRGVGCRLVPHVGKFLTRGCSCGAFTVGEFSLVCLFSIERWTLV